jgi:hypothetical protein
MTDRLMSCRTCRPPTSTVRFLISSIILPP